MWRVLLINWMAFLCFALLMGWSRYRLESMRREVEEAQALESLLGDDRGPSAEIRNPKVAPNRSGQ